MERKQLIEFIIHYDPNYREINFKFYSMDELKMIQNRIIREKKKNEKYEFSQDDKNKK